MEPWDGVGHAGEGTGTSMRIVYFLFYHASLWGKYRNWCSYLKLSPPSATMWLSPSGNELTNRFKWAFSNARQTSSSEYFLKGSKLRRSVPLNKTGSCGIMVSRDRRSWRPMCGNVDIVQQDGAAGAFDQPEQRQCQGALTRAGSPDNSNLNDCKSNENHFWSDTVWAYYI